MSMADVVSKAEGSKWDKQRATERAEKEAHEAKYAAIADRMKRQADRRSVLEIAAKIPQQGGTFWNLVTQIENYIEHGDPTAKTEA